MFVKRLDWSSELLAICRNTKTYLWDITDLDNIVLENTYFADITVIDHNQYIKEPYTFQSNYMVSTTQIHKINYRPPTKLLEGNVFTGVCAFTVGVPSTYLPPTYLPPTYLPPTYLPPTYLHSTYLYPNYPLPTPYPLYTYPQYLPLPTYTHSTYLPSTYPYLPPTYPHLPLPTSYLPTLYLPTPTYLPTLYLSTPYLLPTVKG